MNKKKLSDLKALLSLPTAPFREHYIIEHVVSVLSKANVPFFKDPCGNIVIGVSSVGQYKKLVQRRSREPVRLFIAHMDHPGFHGVKWLKNRNLLVKWFGGSPVKYVSGAKVSVFGNCNNTCFSGKIIKPKLVSKKWAIDSAEVRLDPGQIEYGDRPRAVDLFGSFKFSKPVTIRGKRLYTNAVDDLCGVFVILQTAITSFKTQSKKEKPFLGLLTRAEEVGFVGAVAHFDLGWLHKAQRSVVCISLEASRTLPGARLGKGPVVRTGDRRTVFSANELKVLSDLAEKVLPGKHQKRIMDGGACEATAATVFGLPVIGISLPLGNYHNQGFEGGPECRGPGGPAPEFVHLDDIQGEIKLCSALMRPGLAWQQPWRKQKKLLLENQKYYAKYMK